jgi:hypothetical protein
VVVALLQRELELDAAEERRRWMEDEAVLAGVEPGGELRDPPVVVGLAGPDSVAAA